MLDEHEVDIHILGVNIKFLFGQMMLCCLLIMNMINNIC